MSELAVRVAELGKKYRLSGPREPYTTLRDQVYKLASAPLKAMFGRGVRPEQDPPFWALKDVSFEVEQGEVVGIIGRNGAGKSTLLKILSRITEPTEGEVDIHGRVGSLLEVGTGFHPELTGRENIYLNGAILGMRRTEITRKFDEIVAFAEVEKFIDTPVKHYSSGMYMRLAFAVAAHLEPEILIVDEVLAVGDAEFQRKCLGKMGDVARDGRTVLFVSHNMAAIQSLCTKAIMLERGRVQLSGSADRVVTEYLTRGAIGNRFEQTGEDTGPVMLKSAEVVLVDGEQGSVLELHLGIIAKSSLCVSIDIQFHDMIGTPVGFAGIGSFNEDNEIYLEAGHTRITSRHSLKTLANGSYSLTIGVADTMVGYLDRAEQCLKFELQSPPSPGCFRRLHQSWGHGCFELPYVGHSIDGSPDSSKPDHHLAYEASE